MIKRYNFEVNVRWMIPVSLCLLTAVCIFSPCRAFGADSKHPAVILSEEEIATFDEDAPAGAVNTPEETATFDENEAETTFGGDGDEAAFGETGTAVSGSESGEGPAPLLHAQHYQPSVYLPGRQKRYVEFHPWVHLLPFAVLVILALATTRIFGKRRQASVLAGKRAASGKTITCLCASIFLVITVAVGIAGAQITYGIKDAVVSLLGDGRELYQRSLQLTPDVKDVLFDKVWWEPEGDSIKFYYSKNGDGTVEACVFVLSDILLKCGGHHKFCIRVSSDGKVEGVKVVELTCPYSFAINNEHFLHDLEALDIANADSAHVDAVSGATTSSKLTVMIVRRALLLFELVEGGVNG